MNHPPKFKYDIRLEHSLINYWKSQMIPEDFMPYEQLDDQGRPFNDKAAKESQGYTIGL